MSVALQNRLIWLGPIDLELALHLELFTLLLALQNLLLQLAGQVLEIDWALQGFLLLLLLLLLEFLLALALFFLNSCLNLGLDFLTALFDLYRYALLLGFALSCDRLRDYWRARPSEIQEEACVCAGSRCLLGQLSGNFFRSVDNLFLVLTTVLNDLLPVRCGNFDDHTLILLLLLGLFIITGRVCPVPLERTERDSFEHLQATLVSQRERLLLFLRFFLLRHHILLGVARVEPFNLAGAFLGRVWLRGITPCALLSFLDRWPRRLHVIKENL
mmetsp:Transcript_4539/g.5621  ORF Transcript_4539/g.5621 Transcript_4539/m.5621 type:complete len:273 (-) Transcript_4539:107-925(-)